MELPNLGRLTNLKYRSNPDLIIQEALETPDPAEELAQSIMTLIVLDKADLANRVKYLAPKYGLEIDFINVETKY